VSPAQTKGTARRKNGDDSTRTAKKGRSGTPRKSPPGAQADDRTMRDVAGVALVVAGIALMIAVLSESSGVAAEAASTGLRLLLGVGAYVLPVALVLWGLSFFIREAEVYEARTGFGLAIILLAVVSIAALGSPDDAFFDREVLSTRGGYLGASLAWVLASLLGRTIGYVVMAGVFVAGLVVIGLSISRLVDQARDRLSQRARAEAPARPTRPQRKLEPPTLSDAPEAAAAVAQAKRSTRARKPKQVDDEQATIELPATTGPSALEGFELPPSELLKRTPASAARHRATDNELKSTAERIIETLADFDIPARVVDWIAGPTVTLFELEIAKGVKVARVSALSDDLALALAATEVRVLAPIPGKSLVGVEVPNASRTSVTLGDVLSPTGQGGPLTLAIGKDIGGNGILADLATMPHLLIGGSTGSGKSVAINAMLMSVLMRATPAEVRLILIDPKRVELGAYNGVPHLYVPVVTEPKEAASALAWAVTEMDRRLKLLAKAKAKNIGSYNGMVQAEKLGEDAEELPYLVVVIDELADLMMVAAKEVEDSIVRIAQLARAAGIHLVVATQRPEANVVTGLIKANITNRIAFSVASAIDSRVILDQPGAEKLVSRGDMLFSTPELQKPKRIQGCFVSEDEVEAAVEHLREQGEPDYHEEILHLKVTPAGGMETGGEEDDPLLWEAADIVVTSGLGSTSMLQRRLKVGYARAGRIMDMLETKGVVGPPDGSKPREVMVDVEDLESLKVFEREEHEEA
jgi:S-DNA-T family DNA segregation ATPase FtsK/SpoIIIE